MATKKTSETRSKPKKAAPSSQETKKVTRAKTTPAAKAPAEPTPVKKPEAREPAKPKMAEPQPVPARVAPASQPLTKTPVAPTVAKKPTAAGTPVSKGPAAGTKPVTRIIIKVPPRPKPGPTPPAPSKPAAPAPTAPPKVAAAPPAPAAPRVEAPAVVEAAAPVVTPVAPQIVAPPPPPPPRVVEVPSIVSVRELADLLQVSAVDIIKQLMRDGVMANINQPIDYDTASIVAAEFGIETKEKQVVAHAAAPMPAGKPTMISAEDVAHLKPRPPVVTVMGHVDHGKTSLLDAIRETRVAAGEAGGITQHIGAYQVETKGRKITFLDTPGHEAFTAMRARGARATDIAVLVVAADDGVMPQTKEALDHARAAGVPIIVALNKIDRPNANPEGVKRQLADIGLTVEEWGGNTVCVPVSAKTHVGIDTLLEMILLVADMAELKANPDRLALGTVIEGKLDKTRGSMATLLVQNGTLKVGDNVVINDLAGRVRAMFDYQGRRLDVAGPATPVAILGLPGVPQAGDLFQVVEDERTARLLAARHGEAKVQVGPRLGKALTLDEVYAKMQAGQVKELNIILKADVQGSIEPIKNSLLRLGDEALKVRLIHAGTGQITESDIYLAVASQAIVIGFNVQPDAAGKAAAQTEGVDVRPYQVIYKLVEDIEKALKGLLEPTFKDVVMGRAQVRQVFKLKQGNIAGLYVNDGKVLRSALARIQREGKMVFDGPIASLRRFTEDVKEVAAGFECGVALQGFGDFREGDVIEFYKKEQVT